MARPLLHLGGTPKDTHPDLGAKRPFSAAGSAPPLTLSKPDETAVGDEVFAVGHPQGLNGTFHPFRLYS